MIDRRVGVIVAILIFGGCAAYTGSRLEQSYGAHVPPDRVVAEVAMGNVDYWSDVKPVIEQRCVVCHGCYDASCQLKMSSIEGIERGASKEVVYQQSRLTRISHSREKIHIFSSHNRNEPSECRRRVIIRANARVLALN